MRRSVQFNPLSRLGQLFQFLKITPLSTVNIWDILNQETLNKWFFVKFKHCSWGGCISKTNFDHKHQQYWIPSSILQMRLPSQLSIVVVFALAACISASPAAENAEHRDRDGKLLPLFNVVKFTNDFCESTSNSRNGTCYTSQECSDLGGTAGSSCAEGFGVCCTCEYTTIACAHQINWI